MAVLLFGGPIPALSPDVNRAPARSTRRASFFPGVRVAVEFGRLTSREEAPMRLISMLALCLALLAACDRATVDRNVQQAKEAKDELKSNLEDGAERVKAGAEKVKDTAKAGADKVDRKLP